MVSPTWAFGGAVFAIHAAVRVLAVSLIWLLAPAGRTTWLPATVCLLYVLTAVSLPSLRHRWLARAASQ